MSADPALPAADTLCALFAGPVSAAALALDDPAAVARAAELAALGPAVAARRREFAAGRGAARRALAGLGLPAVDILIGPRREPVVPPGAVLSISHDAHCAIAVAGPSAHWLGIGVDTAPAAPLAADLIGAVCRAEDLRELAPGESPGARAALVFCLKEALFKAIYPQIGQWMEFEQSALRIDHRRGHYSADFFAADGAPLTLRGCWQGRFLRLGERWLAGAAMAVDCGE